MSAPSAEQCAALIQLDLIARRIDLALDRKDRRWFVSLCKLRADQKRRLGTPEHPQRDAGALSP